VSTSLFLNGCQVGTNQFVFPRSEGSEYKLLFLGLGLGLDTIPFFFLVVEGGLNIKFGG